LSYCRMMIDNNQAASANQLHLLIP
jgi:hypothetical protein